MKPINNNAITDAAINLILPEDLEAIDRRVFDPKADELINRSVMATPSDLYPPFAETVTYQVAQESGAAKIINNLGTDYPYVDVGVLPITQQVYELGVGFRLTRKELRAARGLGIPVDTAKATKARKAAATLEQDLFFNGDATIKIVGLYNISGRATADADNGEWDTLTDGDGYKITADIRKAIATMHSLAGYRAKVLILHPNRYEDLSKTVSTNYDATVLERIKALGWFPGGIFTSHALDEDVMLILDNGEEQMRFPIIEDLTRLDLFPLSPSATMVPFEQRLVGPQVVFPKAVLTMSGLKSA